MTQAPISDADRMAWEIYGPAIFHLDMTGPQALANHAAAAVAEREAVIVAWLDRVKIEASEAGLTNGVLWTVEIKRLLQSADHLKEQTP